MYKMKLLLKIIITILSLIAVIITNNYYVLFGFLFVFVILFFINNKKVFSLINLLFLVYLIYSINNCYIIIKLLLIIDLIYLFIIYLSIRQKIYIKNKYLKGNQSPRNQFNEKYYKNNLTNILEKVDNNYEKDVEVNDQVNVSLERLYLQSRIRFFGFKNVQNYHYESHWKRIDYMILLLSIVIFIIIVLI